MIPHPPMLPETPISRTSAPGRSRTLYRCSRRVQNLAPVIPDSFGGSGRVFTCSRSLQNLVLSPNYSVNSWSKNYILLMLPCSCSLRESLGARGSILHFSDVELTGFFNYKKHLIITMHQQNQNSYLLIPPPIACVNFRVYSLPQFIIILNRCIYHMLFKCRLLE